MKQKSRFRQLIICCAFLLLSTLSFAQIPPQSNNPKALKKYNEALVALEDNRSAEGISLLSNALQIDSNFIDAYLSLAGALGNTKQYKKAVTVYERARLKDSNYFTPYELPFAINLAGLGQFEEALAAINQFLTLEGLSGRSLKAAQYRKKTFEFAVSAPQKNKNASYVFAPKNLGDSVNSRSSEYYPSVTVTDDALVFTRRTGNAREDFMLSGIPHKDSFNKAAPLDGDINVEPRKGAITVSQDGDWLFFAADIAGAGLGGFDIYKSVYTPTGWSEQENLGDSINTDFWESSPAISPDKRVLYFSSNRPGGYGGADLYVGYLKPNGRWTEAVNMGPSVNTAGDELAPFIHADNQTLYFCSDGWPVFGEKDIFFSKKAINGLWQKPNNLGYPINTPKEESSLFISNDGKQAYFASDNLKGYGGLDLYSFELYEAGRPEKVTYVKGTVFDNQTKEVLAAQVEIISLQNFDTVYQSVCNASSGEFLASLPEGKTYALNVSMDGYLFYSGQFILSNKNNIEPFNLSIPLDPIAIGEKVALKNIFFESNSFQLKNESKYELLKLSEFLIGNQQIKIEIGGHTDYIGDDKTNVLLSSNRAKSVFDYLIKLDVPSQQLVYKGYGKSQPIESNNTEQGRATNRRTEIKIIAK